MNTYIKNVGMTKTFINNNNKKSNKEIKWDGDYDGKIAKLNLNINDNGKKEDIHMELTNDDLLKLLNTPSINMPIDKRLESDFLINNDKKKQSRKYHNKKGSKTKNKNKFTRRKNKK
jgi:hypothetical protein